MKTIVQSLLVLAAVIVPGLSSIAFSKGTQPQGAVTHRITITETDVINYLVARDYIVVTCDPVSGTCNWECETYKEGQHYLTTVFTDCNSITGHEDIDL